MNLISLLFSFKGRINRAQYWGGTLGVAGVNFIVGMVLGASSAISAAAQASSNPAAALGPALGTLGFICVINSLAAWCGMALQVKRFHDRGRTGWLAAIPSVLLLWMIMSVVGAAMGGQPPAQALGAIGLPFGLLMLVSLAFFIDLGCMPGKQGPNQYGDPPGSAPSSPSPGFDPTRPQKAAPANGNAKAAAGSLLGAEAAMERAISGAARPAARVANAQAAPSPRAPAPVGPMGGSGGGFGRRAR